MKINIPKVNISNNKNLIPAAVVVAGILIAGAFVYVNFWPKNLLSAQQAAEKAIVFINQNIEQGATAALVQVTEENNVYKISLKVNETPYESYITKDGKFLFPSGIDLETFTSQLPTTEVPEEQSSAVASAAFAQCLTDKGMKFYGSSNCSWCAKEKTLLGDSLQYINYIECTGDDGQTTKACQDANITSYPTWQLPNGRFEPGYKTLEQLAEVSGCTL